MKISSVTTADCIVLNCAADSHLNLTTVLQQSAHFLHPICMQEVFAHVEQTKPANKPSCASRSVQSLKTRSLRLLPSSMSSSCAKAAIVPQLCTTLQLFMDMCD
ncbi:hypothetical protein AMECASPLE_033145 [Ameca splendens]|uniref:Uncharacterized protein n=1 Tax=Ameca splendens TaxID=208324 RepID=A0ABV1AD67_9TELE